MIEQIEAMIDVNLTGVFLTVKAALPHLKPGSSIINTGSITGLEGNKELLDYSATKGAIHAFTKSLAQNLVERGIRVNCVSPGPVWTPLNVADKPARQAVIPGRAREDNFEGLAKIAAYYLKSAKALCSRENWSRPLVSVPNQNRPR